MKIEKALNKLYSLHKFGVKLGLDNIQRLLKNLGNPENKFPSVHIAGSNGKGSTASFIASVLTENGMKVGLYTSPHFVRFNERIRINGVAVPDDFVADFMEQIDNYITDFNPTFFEVTTALAYSYFAKEKVDVAVIETGLGGRLDATNTLKPLASVITTIGYEHTNILGEDLISIAREKAGIIKQNTPLFVGALPGNALETIADIARKEKANLIELKKHLIQKNDYVEIVKNDFEFTIYKTGLRGYYQFVNSALATLVAVEIFGIKDYRILSDGLLKVVGNTGIQGRYEVFNESPKVIFDAAHNSEGVEAFIREFEKEEKEYSKRILIFGAMKDKDVSNMLTKLAPHFNEIFITSIDYQRAATKEELLDICRKSGIVASPLECPVDFIEKFIRSNKKECLTILGSIYILGNIKGKILAKLNI